MILRDATPTDFEAILELNRLSVEVLSPMAKDDLEAIATAAHCIRVMEPRPQRLEFPIAAFLIALRKGADYQSPNFLWFDERYDDFLYVDRVVVAAGERGHGLGQRLYADITAQAQVANIPRIALEVDIEPPNLPSLKFHQQQGFIEVGQLTPYGNKVVSLQIKSVPSMVS